jgi:tryptophanase
MSDKQWAAMMVGDESYAGASSYYKLKDAIKDITGFNYFLPTHQGRAAENVLFSVSGKRRETLFQGIRISTQQKVISNSEKRFAIDCTIDVASDTTTWHPFKGNVDTGKTREAYLKTILSEKDFLHNSYNY